MSFLRKDIQLGASLTLAKLRNESRSNLLKAQEKYDRESAAHFNEHSEAWVEFAQAITKAITEGRTVTRADVPESLTNNTIYSDGLVKVNIFDQTRPTKRYVTTIEESMENLLAYTYVGDTEKIGINDLKAAGLDGIYSRIDWTLVADERAKKAGK